MDPSQSWWNPNVLLAMTRTGSGCWPVRRAIDDVLDAAARKQGPVIR
jgi:hypothetical protein